jgi:hypothetical protein
MIADCSLRPRAAPVPSARSRRCTRSATSSQTDSHSPVDVQDFIADLRKRRIVHGRSDTRPLATASIDRSIELLRHMLNWAVDREYLDRAPFRRGTETLIRKLREDNRRHRRVTEDEARLLQVSQPLLRS